MKIDKAARQLREMPRRDLLLMAGIFINPKMGAANLTVTELELSAALGIAMEYIAELKYSCAEGDFNCLEHRADNCSECGQEVKRG